MVGLAQRFLEPATESAEATATAIESVARELHIAMFCVGAANLGELQRTDLGRRAGGGT